MINGKATGAVRASFGYMSSESDADALVSFLETHFVISSQKEKDRLASASACEGRSGGRVGGIEVEAEVCEVRLYPIKSCGAQSVLDWPIDGGGLRFDREWALIDPNGVALTAKVIDCLGDQGLGFRV